MVDVLNVLAGIFFMGLSFVVAQRSARNLMVTWEDGETLGVVANGMVILFLFVFYIYIIIVG